MSEKHKYYKTVVESSKLYKAFYSGKGLDELLLDYRKSETDNQKNQRKRITIYRSKHVCNQIENILDQLQILDTPAYNVSDERVGQIAYEINLNSQCFKYIKYLNLVDPNAFLVIGMEDDTPKLTVVKSSEIEDYKINNERCKYLRFKRGESVYEYSETDVKKDGKVEAETGICYAFPIGYLEDSQTDFNTYKSILDPASELLKQLIWDGSELDTIKGAHGIIKTFTYAPRCNYQAEDVQCHDGTLYAGHEHRGTCPKCKGSGLQIHTSSQDVIILPEPIGGVENGMQLDKMIHTVFIPDSILETRKKDIQETEEKIIRTVFNSNTVTSDEVTRTATELNIDVKGVYSALNKLGNKVSDCYIWAIECIADMMGVQDIQAFHSYTMDLNLDSLENILSQRKTAIEAGVSSDVINVIDYSIQKKQHMDNPTYLNQYNIWNQHKPFTDKSQSEKMQILATLRDDNHFKVLYNYWAKIRSIILNSIGEQFYELDYNQREEVIKEAVQKLITDYSLSLPETRVTFDDIV